MACIGAGGVVLAAAGVGTAGAVAGGIGATAVADRGAVGTTVARSTSAWLRSPPWALWPPAGFAAGRAGFAADHLADPAGMPG
jgi:hypothetical protein